MRPSAFRARTRTRRRHGHDAANGPRRVCDRDPDPPDRRDSAGGSRISPPRDRAVRVRPVGDDGCRDEREAWTGSQKGRGPFRGGAKRPAGRSAARVTRRSLDGQPAANGWSERRVHTSANQRSRRPSVGSDQAVPGRGNAGRRLPFADAESCLLVVRSSDLHGGATRLALCRRAALSALRGLPERRATGLRAPLDRPSSEPGSRSRAAGTGRTTPRGASARSTPQARRLTARRAARP